MAAPSFTAAGTFQGSTTTATPGIPAGTVAGDILLLFVESENEAVTLSTANGFAQLGTPVGTGVASAADAVRITVFWKRATGSDAAPVVADAGDHVATRILGFRGCRTAGNPWDGTPTWTVDSVSDTQILAAGPTTTLPDCLVVIGAANVIDTNTSQTVTYTNANLSSLGGTGAGDNTVSGTGGGFNVGAGIKATAGAVGDTQVDFNNATQKSVVVLALAPFMTRTHTTDALIAARTTTTHTTDGYVAAGSTTLTLTHTTDALIKKTSIKTHTTDAYVRHETHIVRDAFSGGAVDTAIWPETTGTGITVGSGVVTFAWSDASYRTLRSPWTKFQGSYAQAKLVTAPAISGASTFLFVTTDGTNGAQIAINGAGQIISSHIVGGTPTTVNTTTYDSATHKYFRIAEYGGTTLYQYSTDGVFWTNLVTEANPVAWQSSTAQVRLGGGTDAVVGSVTVVWDDFNVTPAIDRYAERFPNLNQWAAVRGSAVSGQFRQTLDTNYAWATTRSHFDLTGTGVTVQVANLTDTQNGTDTAFIVYFDRWGLSGGGNYSNRNSVYFYLENTGTGMRLRAQKKIEGTSTDLATVAWTSAIKWLRIRESGGTLYWDYSNDGINWTNLASAATFYRLDDATIEFYGGQGLTNTTAYVAWANLNLGLRAHTTDAFVSARLTRTHTTDALIASTLTKTHTTDARIAGVDVPTLVHSGGSTVDGTSYSDTLASTPGAGLTTFVHLVYSRGDSLNTTAPTTVTVAGVTLTLLLDVGFKFVGTQRCGIGIYAGTGAYSGTALSISGFGYTATGCRWDVFTVPGARATNPLAQTGYSQNGGVVNGGTLSPTLLSQIAAGSRTFLITGIAQNGNTAPDTGWTELSDDGDTTPESLMTAYATPTAFDSSVVVTNNTGAQGAMAAIPYEVYPDNVVTSTKTHTTDALIKATSTKTHTTDALIKTTSTKTHTTDALIKATLTRTHTTDAVVAAAAGTKTHTTSAFIVKDEISSESQLPGSIISGLTGPATTQWGQSPNRVQWWNGYKRRWDTIAPITAAAAGSGSDGDWWLLKDAAGTAAPHVKVVTGLGVKPDVRWDEVGKKLYVLMSNSTTGKFYSFTYNDVTDTYTIAVNGTNVGLNRSAEDSITSLGLTPNGHLWVAMNGGTTVTPNGINVTKSTDGGATWASPVQLRTTNAPGKQYITHFTNGGTTYVAIMTTENSGVATPPVYATQYFHYIDQNAAGWTTPGNWSNENSAVAALMPANTEADDEMSGVRDPSNDDLYFIAEWDVIATTTVQNTDPHVVLLKRTAAGTWSLAKVLQYYDPRASYRPSYKRPVISLDTATRRLYVAWSLDSSAQMMVYYRSAPISDLTTLGEGTTAQHDHPILGLAPPTAASFPLTRDARLPEYFPGGTSKLIIYSEYKPGGYEWRNVIDTLGTTTRVHTTDAHILGQLTRTHTTDAVIVGPHTLFDTFPGAATDSTKWDNWNSTVSGGTLRQTLDGNYGQIDSKQYFNLTGTSVQARIVTLPSTATGVDFAISTVFDVYNRSGNNFNLHNRVWFGAINSGSGLNLVVFEVVADVQSTVYSAAFNTSTMKVLRIREASGTLYFDYSADGINWTNAYSRAVYTPVTHSMFEITSGTTNGANLGVMEWDDVVFNAPTTLIHTTDAIVKKTLTRTHTTDAYIPGAGQKTHTTDALIKATLTRTHTTNALVKATLTRTHTTNALIRATITRTHTTDATLRATLTRTHTTDATLRATLTRTHTTNAYVVVPGANTRTHTTDALIRASITRTHTTDALVYLRSTKTHTTNAYILGRLTRTHATDALIRASITRTHTTDADVKKTLTRTHTTDALIYLRSTRTHTTNAFILQITARTHTTDALIRATITRTHTTDADVKKTLTQQHTTDVIVGLPYKVRTHATDAYIFNPYPTWPQDSGTDWPGSAGTTWPQTHGGSW